MPDFFDRLADELVRVASIPVTEGVAAASLLARRRRWIWARWRRRRLNGPLVAVLILVGASGTVGGLALAGDLPGVITPEQWLNGGRVNPEASIAPDQAGQFAILVRPRVASDALPPDDSQVLTDSPAAGNGPNVALSRRVSGLASPAWVVPGNGTLCLIAVGAGQCASDAEAEEGYLSVMTGSRDHPGESALAGVVPDGVTSVTVTNTAGESFTLPVVENVYMTTLSGAFQSMTFIGPNGSVTIH